MGNFLWYVTDAIPGSITWPVEALAAVGGALAILKRGPRQLLLPGFIVVFLVGVSLSPLHWQRWIIQILPLLALLAAYALVTCVAFLATALRLGPSRRRALTVWLILLFSAMPASDLISFGVGQTERSTRVQAREWILGNLPVGSRIAQEWYTAPLVGASFDVSEWSSLAVNRTLEDYFREGYRYVVASSSMYSRFLAEPDRYPAEVAFYQKLFAEGYLLRQFEPSFTRAGPVVRIYELRDR